MDQGRSFILFKSRKNLDEGSIASTEVVVGGSGELPLDHDQNNKKCHKIFQDLEMQKARYVDKSISPSDMLKTNGKQMSLFVKGTKCKNDECTDSQSQRII